MDAMREAGFRDVGRRVELDWLVCGSLGPAVHGMRREVVQPRPDEDGEEEPCERQRGNEGDQQLHRSAPTP